MNEQKILICISGWGSRCEIFDLLLAQCPVLSERRRRIDLPWQNFSALAQSERAPALLRQVLRELDCTTAELARQEIVVLAWSLGCLLALEFCLELCGSEETGSPTGPAPRLILQNATASMCSSAPPLFACDLHEGDSERDYPAVEPGVLRLMQRKLVRGAAAQYAVMQDFARNCQHRQQNPELFVTEYCRQASSFSPTELVQGLDYLIHCDLRTTLRQSPLPCSTLLLSGREDVIIPPAQGLILSGLLPASRHKELKAGHNLLLPPAADLNKHIKDFLAFP